MPSRAERNARPVDALHRHRVLVLGGLGREREVRAVSGFPLYGNGSPGLAAFECSLDAYRVVAKATRHYGHPRSVYVLEHHTTVDVVGGVVVNRNLGDTTCASSI